jgi:hypothetical protein
MEVKEAVYRRADSICLVKDDDTIGCFYLGKTYDTREYRAASGAKTIMSANEAVDKVSYWVFGINFEEQCASAEFIINEACFSLEEAMYRMDLLQIDLLDEEGTVVKSCEDVTDIDEVRNWLNDTKTAVASFYLTAYDYHKNFSLPEEGD